MLQTVESEEDSDPDESRASKMIQRKEDPTIFIMYQDQIPVHGYKSVPVGNPFISRNLRKRCLERGYDLYEYKAPSGYKNYTTLAAIFAPRHIVKEVIALDNATKAKRAKARERSEARERKKAWASFDKLLPHMPESGREALFARAFEKRSGRIGHKRDLIWTKRSI